VEMDFRDIGFLEHTRKMVMATFLVQLTVSDKCHPELNITDSRQM
jgi:hypothetical protein